MSFKFPTQQRLNREEDFKRLLKKGRKIRNRFFFFYFLQNDCPYHRFAISVNRKMGNAVRRNYIKRMMKEWFRLNRHLVNVNNVDNVSNVNNIDKKRAYDIWIMIKHPFDRTNVQEIEQLFLYSLKKITR